MKPSVKTARINFDLSDRPALVQALRQHAAETGVSQKNVVVRALEAYFAQKQETRMLLRAAESSFMDWDNEEDEVYNDL